MATQITPTLLNEYFVNKKRHKGYKLSCELYEKLEVHAEGEFPDEIIGKMRPSESQEVFEYRKNIYEPITEAAVSRIVNFISKMRKSRDWIINHPAKIPSSIKEGESLHDYTEKNFPFSGSITNRIFSIGLLNYLIDANAVEAMLPLNPLAEQGEFIKPYPIIFNSDRVLEYQEDDFCVLESTDKSKYKVTADGNEWKDDGKVFYVVSTEVVQRWEQTSGNGECTMVIEYTHGLGYMPARKLKGIFHKALDTAYIYKSRIASIVPHLNKAARESSDLDAEVVQHVHSEKWVYMSTECPKCDATGLQTDWIPPFDNPTLRPPICNHCNGSRYISTSPFKHLVMTPNTSPDKQNGPVPPAGYIEKNVEIVKIQDERIENHFYNAFSSIELQNLARTPLNQSGAAKDLDYSQQEIFLHSVAEDLVNLMDWEYKCTADYRYKVIVPNDKERYAMLPNVNVPEKFNLINSSYLIAELKSAKDAGLNPILIQSMEIELAGKQFSADSAMKKKLELVIKLDPLYGKSSDQKNMEMMNGGIIKEDYILSCMIVPFVDRALRENKDFATLQEIKQWEILYGYVAMHMDSQSAAAQSKKLITTA